MKHCPKCRYPNPDNRAECFQCSATLSGCIPVQPQKPASILSQVKSALVDLTAPPVMTTGTPMVPVSLPPQRQTQSLPVQASNNRLSYGPFHAQEFVGPLRVSRSACNDNWTISVEFRQSSSTIFREVILRVQQFPTFEQVITESGQTTYRVTFSASQIKEFESIYSLVKQWKLTEVKVSGRSIPLPDVNKWLRCFRDKAACLRSNPLFCWGASSMTFNLFGCHRTMIRDAHPEWTDNWYEFASMRQDGVCLINKAMIAAKIAENLQSYNFCPALNMDFVTLGFSLIPDEVNPRRDRDWEYVYLADRRTPGGVRPRLTEIVLDTTTGTISTLTGKMNISMGLCTTITVTPQFANLYLKLQSYFGMQQPPVRY